MTSSWRVSQDPVLVVGPAGSGKDALAEALRDRYGYVTDYLAADLKAIIAEPSVDRLLRLLYPVDERPAGWKPRAVLQRMGDIWREQNDALFILSTIDRLRQLPVGTPWVVADARRAAEIDGLRAAFPAARVVYCAVPFAERQRRLLQRDGHSLSSAQAAHPTEREPAQLVEKAERTEGRDPRVFVWRNVETKDVAVARAVAWITAPLREPAPHSQFSLGGMR